MGRRRRKDREIVKIGEKSRNNEIRETTKNIRELALTKRLNFLIGSGVSSKTISLMNPDMSDEDLIKNVKEISKKILEVRVDSSYNKKTIHNFSDASRTDDKKIFENLTEYVNFFKSILDIINLSNSRTTPKSVNIFTTNYDLYIEKSMDELSTTSRFTFNDGASGYFKKVLDSSNYNRMISYKGLSDNYISEIPSISLIKPHGSVNWISNQDNDQITIHNHVVENPKIVLPTGFEEKETYLDNHYFEMLRIFQLELDKPQSVLFVIGFSFQDKHIAKMIRRALQNPELIIMVFGYVDTDKEKYLENLCIDGPHRNLKIYIPSDFGDDKTKFDINDLTAIINGVPGD